MKIYAVIKILSLFFAVFPMKNLAALNAYILSHTKCILVYIWRIYSILHEHFGFHFVWQCIVLIFGTKRENKEQKNQPLHSCCNRMVSIVYKYNGLVSVICLIKCFVNNNHHWLCIVKRLECYLRCRCLFSVFSIAK